MDSHLTTSLQYMDNKWDNSVHFALCVIQISIFENEDISLYIWIFISFNDYTKCANVSKYFAKLYKNTSFNDMLNSKYYELNNIINFCNFSIKHIAKVSKYHNNPQFMRILLKDYVEKYNLEDYIKSKKFIITLLGFA